MVKVVWDKQAINNRIAFLAYGEKEFGLRTAIMLNERIESYVRSLSEYPYMGKVEHLLQNRKRLYRSLVIHKRIKLVYY